MGETISTKRALVEGAEWMGMWTEVSVDALEHLGFQVDTIYSNKKNFYLKILSFLGRCGFLDIHAKMKKHYSRKIFSALMSNNYDVYLSISGKLNSGVLKKIRNNGCKTKIIYWIGDVFNDVVDVKFTDLNKSINEIDCIAISDNKLKQNLEFEGYQKLYHLPFGVSELFHKRILDNRPDPHVCRYGVSFVGTRTPQREELLEFLNDNLSEPVALWGRGWNASVNCQGRLSHEETLQVYAQSKISLNIHQVGVLGGGNIRYYEIPAVGGFQICDWQAGFSDEEFGSSIVSFKSKEDLLDKVNYYLQHEQERIDLVNKLITVCYGQCLYSLRFQKLLSCISSNRI